MKQQQQVQTHGSSKQPPRQRHAEYAARSLDFSQNFLLMQTVQVAVGLFSLPRVVSEQAHHDGWIAILIAGLMTQFGVLIIVLLMRRFGELDLYGIFRKLFGKWVGIVLGALFALYCICATALVSRTYIELVQTWLFPTTQPTTFFVLLIVPILYCATGGIRVLGRFGVATFLATFWMVFLLIAPGKQIQLDNYRPFLDASLPQLLLATWQCSASVVGFETLLVFYPFIQRKETALLASSMGIWLTTLIYLAVTVVSIGFYSEQQIVHLLSPTLHLYKIIELPLIERLEHIGVAVWSFLIVNTASTYLWSAGRFLMTFHKWKEPTCIYFCLPLVVVLGLFPKDVFLLNKFELYLGAVGAGVALGLPLLLLLCALLLRKKGDPPPNTASNSEEASAS